MNDTLKQRIVRRLESMSDERGYQILDYVEFLESKYAERVAPTNLFARMTETVEDVMRAGKIPVRAISGTIGIMDSATKVMKGSRRRRKRWSTKPFPRRKPSPAPSPAIPPYRPRLQGRAGPRLAPMGPGF